MPSCMRSTLFAMLFLQLIGCGDSGPPVGRLTGTVSYDEQPMAEGTILATNHDGSMTTETAVLDGKFSIEACPLGEVRLIVVPPEAGRIVSMPERPAPEVPSRSEINLSSAKRSAAVGVKTALTQHQREQQLRYQHFPSEYRQFDKTPLRTTIHGGDNEFHLVLKSNRK